FGRFSTQFTILHFPHHLQFETFTVTNNFHRYFDSSISKYQSISGRDQISQLSTLLPQTPHAKKL
ncbi:MAG TPA: hypothetical protein VH619_05075, partial [Verrucomicrobiae bacterium]|nr:hypothetical protein [Verrucomicrobiae bacterium]